MRPIWLAVIALPCAGIDRRFAEFAIGKKCVIVGFVWIKLDTRSIVDTPCLTALPIAGKRHVAIKPENLLSVDHPSHPIW